MIGHLPAEGPERLAAWGEIEMRYAYLCPSDRLLRRLQALSPIVELGAGNGYWARLMADRGIDVVAIDNFSWYRDEALSHQWYPVERGDHTDLARHGGRTLLIVRPPRPGHLGGMIRSWPGARLVLVTPGRVHDPDFDEDECAAWDEGGWHIIESRRMPHPFYPTTTWAVWETDRS